MNAVLIALFISTGAPGVESPAVPVVKLAGGAKTIEAVLTPQESIAHSKLERPAVHFSGEKKSAFVAASSPRPIV